MPLSAACDVGILMFAHLGIILHRCVHACLKWTQPARLSKKRDQTGISLADILILTDAHNGIDTLIILCIRLRKNTFPYFSTVFLLQKLVFSSCHLSVFGRTPWSPPTDYQGNCWLMLLSWFQPTRVYAVHRAVLETSCWAGPAGFSEGSAEL